MPEVNVESLLLALTGVAVLGHAIGMLAALRYTGRLRKSGTTAESTGPLPGLALLKPVKGLEDDLRANLESFYTQSYPGPLQVVFASAESGDPGIALAREVAASHPEVPTAFVLAREDYGLNPKVGNLRAAMLSAEHDLVLQSDANVRLRPGHLRRMVGTLLAEQASLVGSLVVGVGERTPAAAVENLQLTAFTAPGLCAAKELVDITCLLGKAMLFRRSELDALGGIAVVKDVLAEDFVMTQLYERAGKKVVLSADPVANVNQSTTLRQLGSRHSRWMKMRVVVSLPGFIGDLGSNPLPIALLAVLGSSASPRSLAVLCGVYLYKLAWDARMLQRLRGHGLGLAQLWATPARDLLLAGIWVYSAFSRTTVWRGRRLRMGPGTLLVADETSALPARVLRRLGLRG
jgi:ceramide glucosyltransferase